MAAPRQVDLGGATLTNGDGHAAAGRTLYVVQNRLNEVAVVKLNRRGTAGRVVDTLTSDGLRRADHRCGVQGQPVPAQRALRHADPGRLPTYWITRIDK